MERQNGMATPHEGMFLTAKGETYQLNYSIPAWHLHFGLWAAELTEIDTLYAVLLPALAANDDNPIPVGREQ